MSRISRRTVLKSSVLAIGLPAIVRAQTDKIKIGHLTPLTGFLGALGSYAQLGIRMAADEINAAGGVMGRPLDVVRRTRSIRQRPRQRRSACWTRMAQPC